MRLALRPHGPLPLLEKELLGAEHGAWTHDAQVADYLRAGEAIVFHEVHGYKRASAAEASLAVHGDQAGVCLRQLKKLPNDLLRRNAAVNEVPAGAP